jgi:1-acyl-sn-glycerol-3-phosphate acyltransferase
MSLRSASRWILARTGWTIDGDPPRDPVIMMIAAPHTSNWDFPLMLLLTWATDVEPHFLMKKEAFRGPTGRLMRRLGGVAVDRRSPQGMVEDLVAKAGTSKRLSLVIAPEGTRTRKEYWKSGFYRIAQQADLPVCLGYCDAQNRRMGFGPVIHLTGDMRADMDVIREFYADVRGVRPERATPARLREEDEVGEARAV